MIKQVAILAIAAICLTVSATATTEDEQTIAKGQEQLLNLLSHIYKNTTIDPEIATFLNDWDIRSDRKDYNEKWQATIEKLLIHFDLGMLERGAIFSIYYPKHLKEALFIFEAFYHAPTLRDLLGIVHWGHIHLNENQFNYVLSVVLIHHPNTRWFTLPQPYQIYPEYFFNTDVMKQIEDYKINLIFSDKVTRDLDIKAVEVNFTHMHFENTINHQEHSLTYFTEDIGLNTWYYYFNQKYAFWMSAGEHSSLLHEKRGEIYNYCHHVLLTRYHAERLSNGLGEVEFLDWEKPIITGYVPFMTYSNGMRFPQRTEWSTLPYWLNKYIERLRDFESRISAVVDTGYYLTKHGSLEILDEKNAMNIIGNLIQGNNDSLNPNYYGSVDFYGRHVLGCSPEPYDYHHILPSNLEHFSTSLRDPGFYRLYNKIMSYGSRYKSNLGPYTNDQLAFNGVKIESATIVEKELNTYFEDHAYLVDNFAYINQRNILRSAQILARQKRLNHKPFTYALKLTSEHETEASFRIFAGPKYDEHGKEITEINRYYYEVDFFRQNLKKGENSFTRKSTAAVWFTGLDDQSDAQNQVVEEAKRAAFYRNRFGVPSYLLLPKGSAKGLPFRFFIHVTKYVENTEKLNDPFLSTRDDHPLGYPLDRPIYHFSLPNMKFIDVLIRHS